MTEMEGFLVKLRQYYDHNKTADSEQMSELISKFADEKNEPCAYKLPNGSVKSIGMPYEAQAAALRYSSRTLEQLGDLLREMAAECPDRPMVKLKPVRAETTVFDSKLGGVPYLPKTMEYPTVREGNLAGKPLYLLAQLNFGELPNIPGFPDKGILQFYTGCDGDDVIGMDFEDMTSQNAFRVIYHENVITDTSALISEDDMPEFDDEDNYMMPFTGEFLLKSEGVRMCGVTTEDHRFEEVCISAYNKLFGTNYTGVWGQGGLVENDEQIYNALYDVCGTSSTHIGGYPYFTQEDPRHETGGFDVLLFQLDSGGDGDDEIMWGDCGVGNFFISEEDLKARDFSKVIYNWDCC